MLWIFADDQNHLRDRLSHSASITENSALILRQPYLSNGILSHLDPNIRRRSKLKLYLNVKEQNFQERSVVAPVFGSCKRISKENF